MGRPVHGAWGAAYARRACKTMRARARRGRAAASGWRMAYLPFTQVTLQLADRQGPVQMDTVASQVYDWSVVMFVRRPMAGVRTGLAGLGPSGQTTCGRDAQGANKRLVCIRGPVNSVRPCMPAAARESA